MEIHYQNTHADFKAFYEEIWRNQKPVQRASYYRAALWDFAVFGLAAYVALKHGEVFVACILAVIVTSYIKRNWSFGQKWNAKVEQSAGLEAETPCTLLLDETGVTEHFSGTQLHVPRSEICDYTVRDDRLFIRYLRHRLFVIPLRYLTTGQRDELIQALAEHKIPQRA